MKTRTLPRRLSILATTVLAVALLHRAGPRLVAGPVDAGELLALVSPETETSGGPRAVLVFQIVDCAGSRTELASWSRAMSAHALDPSVGSARRAVVGVLVGPVPNDEAETRRILDEAGLDFPVRRDPSGRVAGFVHGLGYRETPVALLLDARGRLERAGAPASLVPRDRSQPPRDEVFVPTEGTSRSGAVSGARPGTEQPS